MGKTERKLTEILSDRKYIDEHTAKRLEDSSKRFESLVGRGLARPRGYNLMTTDNCRITSVSFNVPNQ